MDNKIKVSLALSAALIFYVSFFFGAGPQKSDDEDVEPFFHEASDVFSSFSEAFRPDYYNSDLVEDEVENGSGRLWISIDGGFDSFYSVLELVRYMGDFEGLDRVDPDNGTMVLSGVSRKGAMRLSSMSEVRDVSVDRSNLSVEEVKRDTYELEATDTLRERVTRLKELERDRVVVGVFYRDGSLNGSYEVLDSREVGGGIDMAILSLEIDRVRDFVESGYVEGVWVALDGSGNPRYFPE